jgi:transposase
LWLSDEQWKRIEPLLPTAWGLGKLCSGNLPETGDREQKQAIGCSRGGRNTKVHALADPRGRLPAGGEAHDCPIAERLIATGKASKHLSGDKAYDSAELRLWLKNRGTKPVIPNRSNRKQPTVFADNIGHARHLVVAPNGVVYVNTWSGVYYKMTHRRRADF